MRLRSIRPLALLAVTASLPGCDPYRCLVQTRGQQYETETTIAGAAVRGSFLLTERRGAESGQFVIWHVRATPMPGQATRVLLREGTPQAPGRVLYEFPLTNAVPATGVITASLVPVPYAGQVPFAEIWDLLQRQPVSFEVVFTGAVAPLAIGPLGQTSVGDWQDACT
jgi:hypothetical protein